MAVSIGPKIGIEGEAEYRKNLQNIVQETKTLKSELKAVSSEYDKNANSIKKNAAEKKILGQQLDAIKEKMRIQSEMLDKATAKYGENSAEAMKWKQALADSTTELNRTKAQLESMPSALDMVGSALQSAGQKMSALGDTLSKNVTAPLVAVAGASVAAFKALDSGADTIVKKTGATGEQLAEFKNIMNDLATTIPTTFDKAGAAVGEVNTRFKLTGDELETLSGQFLRFSELNNTDVSSSIDQVQKAMAAFGVPTSQASAFLDTLNKTGQETGISMNTLLSSMVANGASLQQLGYSASDAVVFLGQLEVSGIDANAVMTGLRKALANSAKEGVSMTDALADLQDEMKSAGSDAEAMNMAMELFGTKAGPQIAQACLDGSISFEALGTSMTDAMGNIETTFVATLDPIDEFKMAMNQAKIAGAGLGTTLLTNLTPLIGKLSTFLANITEKWSSLSPAMQDTIVKVGAIVATVGPLLSVGGRIISGAGTIISLISTVGGFIGATLIPAIAGIASAAVAALPAVVAFMAPFLPFIAIGAAVVAAGVLIYKNWDTIKEKCAQVKEWLTEKFNAIKTNIVNAWTNIKTKTSEAWEGIKTKIHDTVDGIKTAVANKVSEIKDKIVGKFNEIKQFFLGLPGQALEWGKDFIQGFINGFTSKITGMIDTVKNFGSRIRSFLHFSRPDEGPLRDYETWMPDFMDGLAKGIKANEYKVENAIRDVADGMVINLDGKTSYNPAAVGGTNNITINVYATDGMDVRDLAQKVNDVLINQYSQQRSVFA